MSGADLSGANLIGAHLIGTRFNGVRLLETVLANIDLSQAQGLDTCEHFGPSPIDYRTLARSGQLPLSFL
ncbi:MAG: pentapeptide repeat-containing protein, partial [Leptolyngbya sp. SIO1D8]|nr:pentapeptide repeat-containing protein [Leptolyngbya sp. SIO1D8]